MINKSVQSLLSISLIACVSSYCNSQRTRSLITQNPIPDQAKVGTPQPEKQLSVRSIDFANFSYPWIKGIGDERKTYAMREGNFSGGLDQLPVGLLSIAYGDVTTDGIEEALVAVSIVVEKGSAAPNAIYIYSFEKERPRLLWAFLTGDRVDGGLRQVYSQDGNLVVELYGKNKVLGTDLFADDGTRAQIPYPYYFTRVRYKWNGHKFRQIGVRETVSDENNKIYGSPIMPQFLSAHN